jgi:hypothetical protein
MRRVKIILEADSNEDNLSNEPLVKGILRFCSSLLNKLDPRYFKLLIIAVIFGQSTK